MKTPKILIVDDEKDIREVLRLALRIDGYEIETAADGPHALELFGDGGEWDLVLLDQAMPGMEGLEVLRAMRRLDPQTRVIMITAYPSVELAAQATAAGAVDFVRKPFTGQAVRGAVKLALSRPTGVPRSACTLVAQNVNGYHLHAVPLPDSEKATADFNIYRAFEVEAASGERYTTAVEIGPAAQDLVRELTGRRHPPLDAVWDELSQSVLANYLWQESEVPPETLRVRDISDEQLNALRQRSESMAP